MALFNRKDAHQTNLEARLQNRELDAAHEYLQRFVDGERVEMNRVTQALALVAVSQLR
jgi:hypothetical protein